MAGLVPAIPIGDAQLRPPKQMPGTRPGMTNERQERRHG